MKDFVSAALPAIALAVALAHPTGGEAPHPAALLLLALMMILSDLSLLFRGGGKLSRVSALPAMALLLLGPPGFLAALTAQVTGALAISLAGSERRKLSGDILRSAAPLSAVLFARLPLPQPVPQLSVLLAFLILSVAIEPRRYRLRPTLLTLFCGPWTALALVRQSQSEPWAALLCVPLLIALARGEDSSFPILVKLKKSLQLSHQKARESTQKAQRFSSLLRAANLMSRSLEPDKLRAALGQAVTSTGLGECKVFLPGEPAEGASLFGAGSEGVKVALTQEPDEEQREILHILTRIFATCWENARLHHQVKIALEETRRSQAMVVDSSRMAAMGLVAAGIAHEVNTPLGAIQLSSELAETLLERNPEKVKQHLAAIQRATERAQKAVARTLQYAKPLGRDQAETFPVAEVVEDALELLSHRIARSQVTVERDLDPNLTLSGERQAFFTLIFNLVLNAADACVHSGPGKVWVGCKSEAESLLLTVKDSGPGIPPELRAKVFEPFFTTKPMGEGTGLGLHLAQQAAEHFGGRVDLEPRGEQGACFVARFPRTKS